ncbi:hypothetical protein A2U01_0084789, partial [Trifolium medium]|nr:hypothetical protein [Trifolium medium]
MRKGWRKDELASWNSRRQFMQARGQRIGGILNINNLRVLQRSSVTQIFHPNPFCAIPLEGRSRRKLA